MQEIKVNELIPHSRNDYFFDNISGQKWDEFLESIKTSGVIEPIVCTQDKTIVSGHQRVRACKELGIEIIMCELRFYDDESKVIKDLIETNIRQRGDIGGSSTKMGNIIRELEAIYGVKNGGDRKSDPTMSDLITQKDIAEQLGMSVDTLNNYKKLTTLIPELQDLVDDTLSPSVASRIIAKLSVEEQQQLVKDLDVTKKLTQKEVQEYIDKLKEKEDLISDYEFKFSQIEELEEQISSLEDKLNNRPTIEKEVTPEDYNINKTLLSGMKKDYSELESQYNAKVKELNNLKEKTKIDEENEPQQQFEKKLKDTTIFFCSRINEFIEKTGGMVWLVDHIKELPEYEFNSYKKAVNMIDAWVQNIKFNLDDTNKLN